MVTMSTSVSSLHTDSKFEMVTSLSPHSNLNAFANLGMASSLFNKASWYLYAPKNVGSVNHSHTSQHSSAACDEYPGIFGT